MYKLILKIAWRNLWKNKVFSLLNIGGLAIGLASYLVESDRLLTALLLFVLIAVLSISLQTFKVAKANPVDALKYE